MSESAPAGETVVPVKITQPEEDAPPSLAEPASGPAAEMSGALAHGDAPSADTGSKPAEPSTAINGAPGPAEPTESEPTKSVKEKPTAPEPEKAEEPLKEPAPVRDADTEMQDAEPATDTASSAPAAAAPETNGTSAAKSKRKSSTGIPEHRSKTLKKKQSKAKLTNLDAKPGDFYLARLRSYPPWPAIICDEDMLPDVLLNTRPVTAKQSDGTYKEPYADDGKKVTDRTFPIMFLHTNEFGWIPNTDLTPLDPEQCKDVSEKGKAKNLVEAYKVAAEGYDLAHFKEMLYEHDKAMREDERLRAEFEAEKAAKAEKKKRKSEVKADDDVEMEDAEEAPKKSSKKRKKGAESDEEEPEKTPKTTKIKLNTGKTPSTDKKTDKKTPKAKSEKKKKKTQESEEEVEQEKEEVVLDPVEARKAREKEVLFLRHKLQKGFLSRDQEPAEAEMPQMASYIKKLEAYGSDLEVVIIRNTKINKVLKGIVKLNTIPKDEEYHFRERSVRLLGEWNVLLGAEPAEAEKKDERSTPTTTNGVHKETEEMADEKIEPKVEEPKENTVPAEEAVEKMSAEVKADAGEKVVASDEIEEQEAPAEEVKTESAAAPVAPAVADRAPESAAGAAEVAEVVKEAE